MSDANTVDWDDAGFVRSSHYRRGVLRALADGPATPTDLSEQTGEKVPHVSRALQRLRDRTLVELLVPEERRKGRYYGRTDRGERVLEMIGDPEGGSDE